MSAPFEKLAVVGLGLLGGSVALAARERGVADRVVGVGRRQAPLEDALARGVIDEFAPLAEAVRGADLVVLGTPLGSMPGVLREAAPELAEGAIVTDVGSVKGALCEALPALVPVHAHYVGSHPMAGSHLRGNAHARADLFEGACCVVMEPASDADSPAALRVCDFWTRLGSRVELRSASAHDEQVAWVSHAPHVLAFAFAAALADAPAGSGRLAGGGFRSFTRIAQSDPELWAEILRANQKALAGPLQATAEKLAELARALEAGDGDRLEQLLGSAGAALARSDFACSSSEEAFPTDGEPEGGE